MLSISFPEPPLVFLTSSTNETTTPLFLLQPNVSRQIEYNSIEAERTNKLEIYLAEEKCTEKKEGSF
jgi:hypothetical protein